MLFDFSLLSNIGVEPFKEFLAHTVVQTSNGELRDLAPKQDMGTQSYPFLSHDGGANEYFDFIERLGLSHLRVYGSFSEPEFTFK